MNDAGDILLTAHELYIRSGGGGTQKERPPIFKVVGLILAIASGLFIGVSFVLKKYGLLKANVKYNEEAGEGYGYLKNVWWWSGMTLMIIGEVCNFVAYAFVDAILVTPLGALSVVVTTILSAIFLKERLSFVGKVGCFMCILGAVVIAINAPEQSAVANINDMKKLVLAPGFLSFAGVIIVGCAAVAIWVAPKYGKKSMLVYLTICSLVGGLSVVATQGLGAAIITQISGTPQFNSWFIYVLLVFVIATLLTEIIFLNKALNLFNAALVTPTYYVYFTSSTIVTSAVLFQGFKGTPAQITTVIMGFLQICSGVVLLQLSKSAKDVPDATVFKGDLDQVRTIAEVEESEYEPRADTIRGGGALLRSLSRARSRRQLHEAQNLREEHMAPIGEDEQVEFDGLRRRRTVSQATQPGLPGSQPTTPLRRQKTVHPPLGMSRFPDMEDEERPETGDSEFHPGVSGRFFSFRSRGSRSNSRPSASNASETVPMSPMKAQASETEAPKSPPAHTYGLAPALQTQDTSYRGGGGPGAIQWAPDVDERPKSRPGTASVGPTPPPHTARRQFSFQHSLTTVFHRNRDGGQTAGGESSHARNLSDEHRPISRGAMSFTSKRSSRRGSTARPGDGTTEEERLGLVKGDSQNLLTLPEYDRESSPSDSRSEPPRYEEDEGWQITQPPIPSPGLGLGAMETGGDLAQLPRFNIEPRIPGRGRFVEEDASEDEVERERRDKDVEGGTSSGAFV